jgi:hypothetical protein
MSEQTIGQGHNSGSLSGFISTPETQSQQIIADLEKTYADVTQRRDAIKAAVERAPAVIEDSHYKFIDPDTGEPIIDPETGAQVVEFRTAADWYERISETVVIINKCMKAAEAGHKKEKAPYLNGGRAVDSFFNQRIIAQLEESKRTLEARQTVYLRKKAAEEEARRIEEARKAAEEADRLRQIAEQEAAKARNAEEAERAAQLQKDAQQAEADSLKAGKAAAAGLADISRQRTISGVTSGLRAYWDFSVEDYSKVNLDQLRPYLKRDAIDDAIRAAIRLDIRDIDGVKIFQSTKLGGNR